MRRASHGPEAGNPAVTELEAPRLTPDASRFPGFRYLGTAAAATTATLALPSAVMAAPAAGQLDGSTAALSGDPAHQMVVSLEEKSEPSPDSTIKLEHVMRHASAAKKNKKSDGCTSIRRRPNDIYMGRACKNMGAKYQAVGGHKDKSWVYSTVLVSGIYKCGYVRQGVLPTADLNPEAVSKCDDYYEPLVVDTDVFFEDYNCGELLPGLNGCTTGTPSSEVQKSAKEKYPTLYGNYATDKASPFNVFGKGDGGFSMPLPTRIRNLVSYRVQVKPPSHSGKAIVVKSIIETPALDWGFINSKYVNLKDRRGGKPVKLNVNFDYSQLVLLGLN